MTGLAILGLFVSSDSVYDLLLKKPLRTTLTSKTDDKARVEPVGATGHVKWAQTGANGAKDPLAVRLRSCDTLD